MKYKLVALDLDGTILNSNNIISNYTVEFLKKLNNTGIKIVIATGRSYSSLRHKISMLELDHPVICYNGAMIRDGKSHEIIHTSAVKESIARELIQISRRESIHLHGFLNGDFHYENDTEFSSFYRTLSGLPGVKCNFDNYSSVAFTKAMFISNPERLQAIEPELREKFGNQCYIAYSKPTFLEIMDISASKSNALRKIAQEFNIKRDEIIAFGDGLNDEDMLDFAGKGVVMLNGYSSLKEKFESTMFSNDEDGVAKYLEALINE
ncbi:MAG: HAD family phosphatase [Spirochaetales bacterium]|nr:HAD family phosphatase [Spirochaetales bacterium]